MLETVEQSDLLMTKEMDASKFSLVAGTNTLADSRKQVKWDMVLSPKHGAPEFSYVPLWCANMGFCWAKTSQYLK